MASNDELSVYLADVLDCGEDDQEVKDTAAAISNGLYEAGQEALRWKPVHAAVHALWLMWHEGEYHPIGPEYDVMVAYEAAYRQGVNENVNKA
jgi:outer membrane protein assembly factor BamD (BamD/ComL family)